jgi:hypothetical protein
MFNPNGVVWRLAGLVTPDWHPGFGYFSPPAKGRKKEKNSKKRNLTPEKYKEEKRSCTEKGKIKREFGIQVGAWEDMRLSQKAKMCFSQRLHPSSDRRKKRKELVIKTLILAILVYVLARFA